MKRDFIILFSVLILASTWFTSALACGCCGGNHNNEVSLPQLPSEQIVEKDVYGTVQPSQEQAVEEKVQCPVMKNWILTSEAADSTEYNGKAYYFCCGGCKEKFLVEPEKYIESQS